MTALFLALICTGVASAAPGELTHQGRLLDAAGGGIDGPSDVTFSLYTSVSGGSAVWSETDSVNLADGYYSTLLGDTSSLSNLDFGAQSYWLGVQPAGSPELGPRSAIGTVPMAMSLSGGLKATLMTTSERDASSPAMGQVIFNTTTSTLQVFDGSDWTGVGSATGTSTGTGTGVGWGYNQGSLGMGDNTVRPYPTLSATLPTDIVVLSAGGYNHGSTGATCAITSDNAMYCSGYESHVPDGLSSNVNTFRQVGPGLQWRDVQMGYGLASCGVTHDNTAYCWGRRDYGGVGDGVHTTSYIRSPSRVIGGIQWKQLSPGGRYSSNAHRAYLCGVSTTTDAANGYCWGLDSWGELGNGSAGHNYSDPVAGLISGFEWDRIETGYNHVCGITPNQQLYCWGYNGYGQVGTGNTTNTQSPALVSGGHSWVDVDIGENHTCGVRTDGVMMCWGYNGYGNLGDGTTSNRYTPTEVVGGKRWREAITGQIHSCGIDTDDRAWCWGYNGNGGLGDGTTSNRSAPVEVYGDYLFETLDAGPRFTMGITK